MRRVIVCLVFLGVTGCKQTEHQRCQVDDDCEGNLICSTSQKICVEFGEMSPDAPTLVDARPPDAPVTFDAPAFDSPEAIDAATD